MRYSTHTNTTTAIPQKMALIQLFRGLAAIVVLLYHSSTLYATNLDYSILDNAFKFGKAGVDFFFVLSGFIIYTVHRNDLGVRQKLAYFLTKRFIRIYPLYWLVLALKLIVKSFAFTAVLSALVLFPYPSPPILNVSWTLSYEVFFYLCFGLLIYFKSRWLGYGLLGCAGAIFLYWVSNLFLGIVPTLTSFNKFLLSAHHLEFLFGVLAAYLISHSVGLAARHWLLGIGLIAFCSVSIFTVWDINRMAVEQSIGLVFRAEALKTITEHHSYLFFGIPSFLIIMGSALIDRFDKWYVPNYLLFIGDASYSIYLTHSTLINFITLALAKVWHYDLAITVLPTMLISVMVGCLVHKYIESPILANLNQRIIRFKHKKPALEVA